MPADQRDLKRLARLAELREERPHPVVVGGAGRQQHGGEKPARRGAAHHDVVGVDVQGIPAEIVGRERDGIGGSHEIAIAEIDDGGVLAQARADDHTRIVRHVLVEDGLQQVGGQLARWQERHRVP